jgi:hypothetical protein
MFDASDQPAVASCYRRFAARLFGSSIDKGAVRGTTGRWDRSKFQLFRRHDGDLDVPLAMISRWISNMTVFGRDGCLE